MKNPETGNTRPIWLGSNGVKLVFQGQGMKNDETMENDGKWWKTMENDEKRWETMKNDGKQWKTMENDGNDGKTMENYEK